MIQHAPSQPVINPISTPTNDTTPTITGTGVNGDTITLFQGATSIGTATVASGVWSITPSALINAATYVITATATDPAGNVSAASTSQTITIDTTVPSINAIATSAFSWGAVLNAIEDDSDGTVTVTTVGVEDGRPLTITLNGNTYTATVSSNATTVTISAAGLQGLTNGQSYTMIANVSDAAGNAATPVTSSSFSVDTSVPSISAIATSAFSWGAVLNQPKMIAMELLLLLP